MKMVSISSKTIEFIHNKIECERNRKLFLVLSIQKNRIRILYLHFDDTAPDIRW